MEIKGLATEVQANPNIGTSPAGTTYASVREAGLGAVPETEEPA